MKKVAILYSDYSPTIDAIKYNLQTECVDCYKGEVSEEVLNNYDLVVLCGYNGKTNVKALNIHHSLLPAFNCDNPVAEAIKAGVKVTGITIFDNKTNNIVAQYPVFIYNDAHFDELESELKYLEQTIYPIVIRKVLENEPFEIRSLMRGWSSCNEACGGCSGCSH